MDGAREVADVRERLQVRGELHAEVVDLPRFADLEAAVKPGRDGDGDDPVVDAVEVDAERVRGRRGLGRRVFLILILGFALGFVLARSLGDVLSLLVLGRSDLFLVALLGQRVGEVLAEDGQIEAVRLADVGVRHVEPLPGRAGVRRGEKVEILPARVEDRLRDVAQAVGDRERPVLVERIDENAAEEGGRAQGVGEPLRVRAPGGGQIGLAAGLVKVFRLDPLLGAGLEVEPVQGQAVIGEGDFLAVGRERRRAVEAGPVELELPDLALSVLGPDVELVFAGSVGEVGDGGAVRRPDR